MKSLLKERNQADLNIDFCVNPPYQLGELCIALFCPDQDLTSTTTKKELFIILKHRKFKQHESSVNCG